MYGIYGSMYARYVASSTSVKCVLGVWFMVHIHDRFNCLDRTVCTVHDASA